MAIDYTQPTGVYRVSTSRDHYMGPDIIVNANNSAQAAEVAKNLGHTPNPYFPPEKIK